MWRVKNTLSPQNILTLLLNPYIVFCVILSHLITVYAISNVLIEVSLIIYMQPVTGIMQQYLNSSNYFSYSTKPRQQKACQEISRSGNYFFYKSVQSSPTVKMMPTLSLYNDTLVWRKSQ